jgi:IS1 family transposase
MSSRRSRGDGGLHWDQSRQRWVATATVGYDGRGKRLVRHSYGRTKTEAKAKLRDLLRSREDGVVLTRDGYTVRQAVEDWLEHGFE